MVSSARKTAGFPLYPLLVLLLAAILRMMLLRDVPPGLTHDEADHGITAWSIVEGVRAIYFTIGYGREPFYDYATAVLMSFLGPTYLAGRLTAVFFSLPLIAAMYAWVKRAFDPTTALLTAASLATSFWPLMVGRQALRSTTLPTLFALAVLLFWLGLKRLEIGERRLRQSPTTTTPLHHYTNPYFLATGLLIGLTFYTYIPARILWGVFPATAVYLMLARRKGTGKVWWGVLLIGGLGLIVAAPLFSYLANNPGTEVRIDELQTPLTAVLDGNVSPLWQNIRASLRLFTIEGDSTIRYNLPGRPFLQPIMGILFYIGLAFAVWHTIQPFRTHKKISFTDSSVAAFLAIAWLLAGISPSLVTGPRWSMTQAVGMQPILYLFPALAVAQIGKLRFRDTALSQYKVSWLIVGLVWGITAVIASNDYFNRWANDSDVRVQYETTMVAAMEYLNANGSGDVAISTITPDPVHTPALAQMTLTNKTITPHWFNGQDSLLIPESASSTVVFPGFTPLPAAFASYFAPAQPIAELPLRETDLDRPLSFYQVETDAWLDAISQEFVLATDDVQFGASLQFLGHDLQTAVVKPGSVIQFATLWQVKRPLPNAQLFTHILGADGVPIAQADKLSVPGAGWQAGDRFIQLHEIWLGEETAVGEYPLAVGLYTAHEGHIGPRQPLFINDKPQGDSLVLPPLIVEP